jgi:hypothetical protein
MVGGGEELVVARGVAVAPELGAGESGLPKPFLDAAGFLGTTTVGASQPPREASVAVMLEARAHHVVHAELLPERPHVWLERCRSEDHGMPELAVPAQPGGRVITESLCDVRPTELGAEPVERGGVEPAKRRADDLLEPVAVAARERPGDDDRVAHKRERDTEPCRSEEKRSDAIGSRQRPVDVESGDDRLRVGGFGHRRTRLYTRCMSDGPEIFDDLYLGLQAGGALRKQRRGEELTDEEREAIGRWQQMSMWRKGIAVGAFAVGTFGLGFTLGGLVFGRRARKA